MKKSCGLSLAVWLALAGAYGYVAFKKTREPIPAAFIGVLGGTFAAMLVGSVWGLVTGGADRQALKRAIAGEPPKDGRLEAASGRVHALGAPLEAPFTGRKCVAYEYDVKSPGGGKSDWAGVGLTACAIDGPRGSVRVLGWAMLDEFPKALEEEMDRARALAYLRGTSFQKLELTNALSWLKDLIADQDGSIKKDIRTGDVEPSVEGRHLEEKVVPEGGTLTVLGIWSEAQRGFAPASSATMNRLYPVSPASVVVDVGKGAWKQLGIAIFFFLALHVILVPMYFLAPGK